MKYVEWYTLYKITHSIQIYMLFLLFLLFSMRKTEMRSHKKYQKRKEHTNLFLFNLNGILMWC